MARVTRFYGLSWNEIQSIPCEIFFSVYVNSIARIEAQEQLALIKSSMMPHYKEEHRERAIKALQKEAFPVDNKDVLTSVEFAKRLGIWQSKS
jgi:hypothetical protein